MDSELLITTNGFKGTWFAIEYGAWMAESVQARVTLLGVVGCGTTTMPAEVQFLPGESKHTWLGITIHEGKHRQIHRMIEALGYQVRTATEGASGIKLAQQERPDLIILDVLMPNMDGYEICRRMRADPGLKDTPILLLTALEERMVDLWGREAGATFSMSKPSRPEHIVSIIEWMLSAKLGPPEG